MITPSTTVICTCTGPYRVCTASPVKVPPVAVAGSRARVGAAVDPLTSCRESAADPGLPATPVPTATVGATTRFRLAG